MISGRDTSRSTCSRLSSNREPPRLCHMRAAIGVPEVLVLKWAEFQDLGSGLIEPVSRPCDTRRKRVESACAVQRMVRFAMTVANDF